MNHNSTTDQGPAISANEAGVQHNAVNRLPLPMSYSVPVMGLTFPGEDRGHSLVEMAQRDLDAALQLLAERAQYITGATGAAIALRHAGEHDMLCRASSGLNAPELGALLSTEFGLSGESVRTRQPLRCDDAERDTRVNREGCRELGIASVAVMPVLSDGEVLGVFELFSGKANAFEARDLSALERLAEMVETAASFAHAATRFPGAFVADALRGQEIHDATHKVVQSGIESETELRPPIDAFEINESDFMASFPGLRLSASNLPSENSVAGERRSKPLFWSAASMSGTSSELDRSHVPMAMRGLRKCQACEFPVSDSRTLCVECEEKQWRGQLRTRAVRTVTGSVSESIAPHPASANQRNSDISVSNSIDAPIATVIKATEPAIAHPAVADLALTSVSEREKEKELGHSSPATALSGFSTTASPDLGSGTEAASLSFLTTGMEPSQSWLAANKYVLGAVVAAVLTVAALVALR